MRFLLVVFGVCLLSTSAYAVLDPDPDVLGVYFDLTADQNSIEVGENTPFNVYFVITNPSADFVHGWEFGYEFVSAVPDMLVRLEERLYYGEDGLGPVNLGTSWDLTSGDYIVGLSSPLPGQPATVCMRWQCMLTAPTTIEIFLGPSGIESINDGMPAYEIGGTILPLGLSTGGPETAVATINALAPVGVESASFGSVKSLFR